MMYRILIVDDEPHVVDWISSLLEAQTEPDLDVCRAYSAYEALNWLNRAKIDIVLTDIRMPEMSGIKLAEKVRENWPQCKVILLTAYAEFDYAYEAIRNNVVGYILKNEDDVRILEEIKKAAKQLDNEMNKLQLLDDMQEQLKESMSVVRNEILIRILKGDCVDSADLFLQLKNTGVNFKPDAPFLLLMGWLENLPYGLTVVERLRQLDKVKRIVGHYLSIHIFCCPVEYGFNRLVWLMQPENKADIENSDGAAGNSYGQAILFAGGMLEAIQQSCMETVGLSLSFALHNSPVYSGQLPETLPELERLINLHMAYESGFILTGKGLTDTFEGMDLPVADALEAQALGRIAEKLKNCLNDNRQDEYMTELEKICKALGEFKSWHSNTAQELYYSAAVVISSHINQRRLAGQIAFKIGLARLFRPYEAGSWRNAADYLGRLSAIIFQLQKKDGNRILENIIQKLRSYIDEHITEDVSLVRLSEVTGYNSSYLSRVFKQNTGTTLNEYICKQKLSGITALLSDESLSISDIAVKTGFDSRTYFNNFFRRMTGMSPQEYRGHLRQG